MFEHTVGKVDSFRVENMFDCNNKTTHNMLKFIYEPKLKKTFYYCNLLSKSTTYKKRSLLIEHV